MKAFIKTNLTHTHTAQSEHTHHSLTDCRSRQAHTLAITLALALPLALGLAGCSEPKSSFDDAPEGITVDAEMLKQYLLDTRPEGAISVAQARQSARPGQTIVVAGQIGAAMEPFSQNYATLVLGDESILYCDEMEDDHCPTPWDACCEDPDKVKSSRASVQLVLDGMPLPGTLKGLGGLSELDHIVVAGTVAPSSTPENLIINASGIYRQN